jgi:catechol 2,3-dioxygenase-like lactoylglutathione lyase family enzyme
MRGRFKGGSVSPRNVVPGADLASYADGPSALRLDVSTHSTFKESLLQLMLTHDHVGLSVIDLEATIEWYSTKLDFAIERRFSVGDLAFAFLTNGNAKLEILGGAHSNQQPPITDIVGSLNPERLHHFCVAVDDLDAALTELRARDVHVIGEPMNAEVIGQRVAFVTDNSGNVIELTEPGTWD